MFGAKEVMTENERGRTKCLTFVLHSDPKSRPIEIWRFSKKMIEADIKNTLSQRCIMYFDECDKVSFCLFTI